MDLERSFQMAVLLLGLTMAVKSHYHLVKGEIKHHMGEGKTKQQKNIFFSKNHDPDHTAIEKAFPKSVGKGTFVVLWQLGFFRRCKAQMKR